MSSTNEKVVVVLQKMIVPICGAVIFAIAASVVVYFMDKNQATKIGSSYDQLFLIKKESEAIAKAWKVELVDEELDPKVKKEKMKPKKVFSPEEKKSAYATVVEKLMQHIKANQGNQVAVEGALLAADLSSEYSEDQVGIEALRSALTGMDKSHFLFAIGQSELGALLAKTDKCNEATQIWESVIAIKEHIFFANNLKLKAGVCYEKMSMYDRAEKLYQEIMDKNPNSSAARTAKKFLLHIKFVKNKGEADVGDKKKNG